VGSIPFLPECFLEVEMTLRLRTFGIAVISSVAFLGWSATAHAQEKLDKNAQFCEDFDQNVILGGKLDEASKYLTDDFKEHNARLTANGLAEFLEKMKAMRASGRGPGGGGRGRGAAPVERTVFSHDDVVVFMRPTPERDDPQNPGRKIPAGTHFDVYRLRNGKIAEHWD
jgi:predicted SnoaL-like aldol condensation-catalyzing enzyme